MNFTKTSIAAALALLSAGTALAQATGPSSSASPYVVPTAPFWSVTSVLTVGDAADNGYRMVGIPDGMGAYANGDGTITVLLNHELGATAGVTRAHGNAGAFVSEWVIRSSDLRVLSGRDLATQHLVWNASASSYVSAVGLRWDAATNAYVASAASEANSFGRLCSADLPAASAFYNAATGLGTSSRIFMNGEEVGNEGRAYGFVATGSDKGKAYELNRLGKFSWENSVANPYSGDKTVVIGLDDSTPGQVYVYTGFKTGSGNEVDRAGLTNGTLRGIKVNATAAQGGASGNLEQGQINGAFSTVLVDTSVNGATQQANARSSGITEFARPEDGHWADANTFYFVTTGATPGTGVASQSARLYRLSFAAGAGGVDYDNGTITMVLDSSSLSGTDGATARSFDNITVTVAGKVLIQEDPGNTSYIAKTWIFDPATGKATQVMESDRSRFITGAPGFLTQDEESSGVIEITDLLNRGDGQRYYLGNMQAHYGIPGELVEGGQLYVMAVPEPGTYGLMAAGLGLVGWMARRRRSAR